MFLIYLIASRIPPGRAIDLILCGLWRVVCESPSGGPRAFLEHPRGVLGRPQGVLGGSSDAPRGSSVILEGSFSQRANVRQPKNSPWRPRGSLGTPPKCGGERLKGPEDPSDDPIKFL